MKILYVAGPYRAQRSRYVLENIRRAEDVAIQLWEMGYAVVCPHLNTMFFEGPISEERLLAGLQDILLRCDGLVVLDGWENSAGTRTEMTCASKHGVPTYFWDNEHDREELVLQRTVYRPIRGGTVEEKV